MSASKEYLLTLKVGEKYIDVKLNHADTKLSIFQKITKVYPNHHREFDDLMLRIKHQLEGICTQATANQQTQESLKMIIKNVYKDQRPHMSQQWALSQITVNSQVRSSISDIITLPEKVCYQKSIQTQPTQVTRQQAKEFKSQSFSSNKSQKESTANKKIAAPRNVAKSEVVKKTPLKISSTKNFKKSKQEKQNKRKCNPDMIKACEAIMKKSNNNGMRTMAKQFLKEKGYLNEDVISHDRDKRKTYLITQTKKECRRNQEKSRETENFKTIIYNQFPRRPTLIVKNDKQIQVSADEIKIKSKSKYSYNISPVTALYSCSLNIHYQKESRQTQMSTVRPQKRYNYLQN